MQTRHRAHDTTIKPHQAPLEKLRISSATEAQPTPSRLWVQRMRSQPSLKSLLAAQLMRGATQINLSQNSLSPVEALHVADGLKFTSILTHLNLSNNRICGIYFEEGRFKGEYVADGLLALAAAIYLEPISDALLLLRGGFALVDASRGLRLALGAGMLRGPGTR